MQHPIAKRVTPLFLVLVVLSLIVGFATRSTPISAHSAVSHVVESKVCPKHAHHLTANPNTVIDGDIPAFVSMQACRIIRNDTYQIIFSDPCMTALGVVVIDGLQTIKADPEGRLSFAVMLEGCDPDIYVVTLRDLSPNHAKYHALIVVDAA